MKQEVCVLPVQCRKCGGVFDLWYDLQEQEKSEATILQRFDMALSESFCWRCRQNLIEGIEENTELDDIETEGDDFSFEYE